MTSRIGSNAVRLHYEERGSGVPVLILHGLFGSLSNWRSVSRALGDKYRVLSLDLRNHGRSPHARPHTYAAMLEDLEEFCDDHELPEAIVIGHSMGGRLAMHLALGRPERVRGLCVLDVSPVGGPKNEVRGILELMQQFDPSLCASRREAGERLCAEIEDSGLASSILMNVGRGQDGKLFWRLGVDNIAADFDSLREPPPPGVFTGPAMFVRGACSSYFPREHDGLVRNSFPQARIATLEGAGHLLHIDRPEELRGLLEGFCDGLD